MFGFSAERPMYSWLLNHLGPPPPAPRRHFSKSWEADPRAWATARRSWLSSQAESHDTEVGKEPGET